MRAMQKSIAMPSAVAEVGIGWGDGVDNGREEEKQGLNNTLKNMPKSKGRKEMHGQTRLQSNTLLRLKKDPP